MQAQDNSRFVWGEELAQWVLRPQSQQMSTWIRYEGPRGGKGWKNIETDEVRYQDESPESIDSFTVGVDLLDITEEQVLAMSYEQLMAFDTAVAKKWAEHYWNKRWNKLKPGDELLDGKFDRLSENIRERSQAFEARRKEIEAAEAANVFGGKPWMVSPAAYVRHQKTGSIPETAYDSYSTREGISWLDKRRDSSKVLLSKNGIEYRSDSEDGTIIAFDEHGAVGFVSNEFGVPGVWVIDEKSRQGIGTELLYLWMKGRKPTQILGQMTGSGAGLARKLHKRLVLDAIAAGEQVPAHVLEAHGLLSPEPTKMSTWVAYSGPRGGRGWRNTATGDVRYQEEMPSERGESQESGETARKPREETPVSKWADDIFEDYIAPNGKKAADNFVKWFGRSKVVDQDGEPLVLYHGTLKNIKGSFDLDEATPESFFGKGIYLTNTPEDASDNYADIEGPDQRQRISRTIDELNGSDEFGDDRDAVEAEAKARHVEHGGAVLPVFAKMENPLHYVDAEARKYSEVQTYWDYRFESEDEEFLDVPEGKAADFIEALYNAGLNYNDEMGNWDEIKSHLYQWILDYGDGESISASALIDAVDKFEGAAYLTDDEFRLVRSEVIRKALEAIGHDGIIDYGVYERWGRPRFTVHSRGFQGMYSGTYHYIVFDSRNVKSATGNNGNFDDSQMIAMSTATDEWVKYTGPRDGRGWKNIRTGDVLYQDERPGSETSQAGRVAVQVAPDKGFKPPANIEELRKQHDAMIAEAESLDSEAERARKEANEKSDVFQKQYEEWLAAGNKDDDWEDSDLNESIRQSLNEVWSRVSKIRDKADSMRTQAAKLLIQHIPERKEYENKAAPSGFDTSLSYKQMVEVYGDERVNAAFDRMRKAQKDWVNRIQYEISMGRITEQQARDHLGFYPDGHATGNGGYAPLPKKLWHVTTAAGAVLSSSLKTRSELNQTGGAGLGGGPEDTISFTDSPETAKEIYYAMLEGRRAARGEITVTEMIRAARDGRGAKQPYLEGVCQYHNSNWKTGDPLPARLQGMLDYEERLKNSPESVDKTSEEHKSYLDDCMDVYKRFASYREWAGGVMDPAFVFNNTDLLREVDPEDVKILEIEPKENTFGYKVSALGEWRAHTGDVVDKIFAVTPADLSDSEDAAVKPKNQRLSTWTKYNGPRGGQGWKNAATGEIRYQTDMPEDAGGGVPVPGRLAGPIAKGQVSEDQAKRMRIRGTTEDVTTCDYCGKDNLKKTVVFELLDAEGNGVGDYRHLGVDCAAKMTKRKSKNIADEAAQRDFEVAAKKRMYDREKPLRIRPADDLNGANAAFAATKRHYGKLFTDNGRRPGDTMIGELTKLRYDSKGNVVRVDLTDPDDVKWYEEHGFTLDSKPQTATKEFKEWFGDSKVVNQDGSPMVVYHGTLAPAFDEFHTNGDNGRDWGMFDRLLGAHFAEDASVTEAFNSGEYAFIDNYHINEWEPERSWWKDKSGELREGLPPLVLVDDGNSENGWKRTIETYDPEIHGKPFQVKDKTGGKYLRAVHAGGRTVPVYLSIQNPLVVVPRDREMDQSAISRQIGELVFPEDKQLFVDAVSKTGRDPEAAAKAWDDLKAGRKATLFGGDSYDSFSDVARNFTGMLNGKEFTSRAKNILKSLGYDGIKYKNTSNNEVKPGASPWAWIIFDDWQAKSSLANQGSFSRSTGKIGMSTRDAYLI